MRSLSPGCASEDDADSITGILIESLWYAGTMNLDKLLKSTDFTKNANPSMATLQSGKHAVKSLTS